MTQMTLKVNVKDPYFRNQPRVPQDEYMVLVIPAQICDELLCGQMAFMDGRTDRQTGRSRSDNTHSVWKLKG